MKKNQKHHPSVAVDESLYDGLIFSMRHARNRLLFFILFSAYTFLSILGTSDKTLYLESAIKMPLLNIELPLLSFYAVMPVFLLVLQFNLLYTFHSYKKFLKKAKKKSPSALNILPKGIYENILLEKSNLNTSVRLAINFLLYILPLLVLTTFWFRFADYQSPIMSFLHLIIILLSVILLNIFNGLTHLKKTKRIKNLSLPSIFFTLLVVSYHALIIFPIMTSHPNINYLKKIHKIEESIDKTAGSFLKRDNWFLPRIILNSEVLVSTDKDQLEVLKELNKKDNSEALLLSTPAQDKQKRYFRLAIFNNCILPNTNFSKAHFQLATINNSQLHSADFTNSHLENINIKSSQFQKARFMQAHIEDSTFDQVNLQNSSFKKAFLINANFTSKCQLQNSDFSGVKAQKISFHEANLQRANFSNSHLQDSTIQSSQLQSATLYSSKLQESKIKDSSLLGVSLFNASLQGSNLENTNLQGANLDYAKLHGAYLYKTKLQGASLIGSQLQGVKSKPNKKNQPYNFMKAVNSFPDLSGISNKPLLLKESNDLLKIIEKTQNYGGTERVSIFCLFLNTCFLPSKKDLKVIHMRLSDAIGVDPAIWVKSQKEIILKEFTRKEFDEIKKEKFFETTTVSLLTNKTQVK